MLKRLWEASEHFGAVAQGSGASKWAGGIGSGAAVCGPGPGAANVPGMPLPPLMGDYCAV